MPTQPPGLTDEQLHHFNTFGYAVLRGVLTRDDLNTIDREHREGLETAFPDEPFDGALGQWTRMANEDTPFFASLTEDPRFLTPAQQVAGEDVLGNGTDAHFAVGDTNWHADTGWQPDSVNKQRGVKYHFSLDTVTAETGALRFVPGSNLLRGHERKKFGEAIQEVPIEGVPCQPAPSEPGDVIIFDIRTWHASFGGRPGRRTCNVEYFRNPETSEEEEMMREIGRLQANSRNMHKYTYPRNWLANPHGSAIRQGWIDRYKEIGYFDQPGVGEL